MHITDNSGGQRTNYLSHFIPLVFIIVNWLQLNYYKARVCFLIVTFNHTKFIQVNVHGIGDQVFHTLLLFITRIKNKNKMQVSDIVVHFSLSNTRSNQGVKNIFKTPRKLFLHGVTKLNSNSSFRPSMYIPM